MRSMSGELFERKWDNASVEINQFESLNGAGERVKSFSFSLEVSREAMTSPQTEWNVFDILTVAN